MCQEQPEHSCHTLKVGNSQPVTSPHRRPTLTFGVASGGEDGARRAEEVREVTGKTFHLLLRCLPTAEERCVAGSTSALPPRQPAREEPGGGAGGERGSLSAAQGAMTASLFFAGRQRRQKAGSWLRGGKLRAGSGEGNSARCQRLSASVSMVQSGCSCLSEGRTGGLLRPLTEGRSGYVWSVGVNTPLPSCVCVTTYWGRKREHPQTTMMVIKIIVLIQ